MTISDKTIITTPHERTLMLQRPKLPISLNTSLINEPVDHVNFDEIEISTLVKRPKKPSIAPEDLFDYKDTKLLLKLLSDAKNIVSKRVNRLTSKQHRTITRAIKYARGLGITCFVRIDRHHDGP
jgi:ribosomal protein S18